MIIFLVLIAVCAATRPKTTVVGIDDDHLSDATSTDSKFSQSSTDYYSKFSKAGGGMDQMARSLLSARRNLARNHPTDQFIHERQTSKCLDQKFDWDTARDGDGFYRIPYSALCKRTALALQPTWPSTVSIMRCNFARRNFQTISFLFPLNTFFFLLAFNYQ